MIAASLLTLFVLILPALSRSRQWYSPATSMESCDFNEFLCTSRYQCIERYKWCNGECECGDCEDENFCNLREYYGDHNCLEKRMFKCDNGGCIPRDGRCDGFPSCPDGSDEYECGCKIINKTEDFISYTAYIGRKRYVQCWNIRVAPSKYLKIEFQLLNLKGIACEESQISIKWRKSLLEEDLFLICPGNQSIVSKGIETFDNTEISFRTSANRERTYRKDYFENFSIWYAVVDIICKRSDVFKCDQFSCIMPEKRCDGVEDCENGLDEHRCERGVFTVDGVNISRSFGLKWLRSQRNAAWGWRENTHRSVIAMYLADGANFNGTNKDEDLTAKQLELQMSTAILRNGTDVIASTQMSMFVNALLVICHDPRNFYGYNLIKELKKQAESADKFHPLPYLALCNANVTPSQTEIVRLFSVLDTSSEHKFLTDIQAIAVIALSCITENSGFSHLKKNVTRATKRFKEQQLDDGSFGNTYMTALIIQALLASGDEEAKDWNLKAAIEFLKGKQNKVDGSFGDFLTTYLILPILNRRSLMDVAKVNCTEKLKMPRDGNPVSDIELKLGAKISVHYFLYIGEKKDQEHPIFLRVPENITVLEMMRLAAEADPKYRFEQQEIKGKTYIYEVSGIVNDPEDGKFWLLYTGMSKESIEMNTQSPDEIIVHDNEHIIMWYKSATFL